MVKVSVFRFFAACLTVALISFSQPATARGQQASAPIRVAFSVWEPFVINDDKGRRGIDISLIDAITRQLDLKPEYIPCPWRRCLKMLADGDIDLMSSLAYTPQRAKQFDYIKPPYAVVSPVFYVRRNGVVRIRDYADLRGLNIGAVVDSRYFEPFDSDQTLTKFNASSEKLLLRMLEAGHIDALVGSDANVDYQIQSLHLGKMMRKAAYHPDTHNEIHLALSPKSRFAAEHEKIASIVRQMRKDGAIDSIIQNFWPQNDEAHAPEIRTDVPQKAILDR